MIEVRIEDGKRETYPYIGTHVNGNVVLFLRYSEGIVLSSSYHEIGTRKTDWAEVDYRRLNVGDEVIIKQC